MFLWFQSAQNLAQISDLQAQLEEALKEKQEVQEKVDAGVLLLAYHSQCQGQPVKICSLYERAVKLAERDVTK